MKIATTIASKAVTKNNKSNKESNGNNEKIKKTVANQKL